MQIIGPGAIEPSDGIDNYTTTFYLDTGDSASWTASAGTPTSDTGVFFGLWTSPNSPGAYVRITATVGSVVAIHDIYITGESLNMRADQVAEGTEGDRSLIHEMENGAPRGRRKSGRKRKYALAFNNRTEAELATIRTLYDEVGVLLPFATYDPIALGSSAHSFVCRFDSDISVARRDGAKCALQISFRVKEA
jgi:hypothetical protein